MFRTLFVTCFASIAANSALAVGSVTSEAELEVENPQHTASSYAPDTGSIERIASAELLRTYTQELAAATYPIPAHG
jgi:hypothetical protein